MIPVVFLRTPYNYDAAKASLESGLKCEDPSLAVQSEQIDADINTIVKRFHLTGELPTNVRVPIADDFVEAMDFRDAMNAIRESEESFMAMPADVRERFTNDPAKFVDFCTAVGSDGKLANLDEMRKLGLAVPLPPKEEAVPAPVVPGSIPVVK